MQCLSGADVWKAIDERKVDAGLFRAALARAPGYEKRRDIDRKAVKRPKLLIVHHQDGLRVSLFELNGAVGGMDGGVARRGGPVDRVHSFLDPGGANPPVTSDS